MDDIKQFLSQNDQFAKHTGIKLIAMSKGSATAVMKITKKHLNAVNIVQGGAIFTLADLTFAAASNSYGNIAVAINASISYMKAVGEGTLTAKAREVSRNPKLASYTIAITDDSDDLIATFQGMVYRKKNQLLATN